MATIVLDRGHHGKLHDERGATHGDLVEEVLTREYMRHAEDRLRELGHRVVVQSSHPEKGYAQRLKRADAYRPRVYVQCHVNAGGGNYGMAGYDARSSWGASCAQHIADRLGLACPELRSVRSQPCSPDDWTKRMLATIAGMYTSKTACGICFEPGFIDQAGHRSMWTPEGLKRVGLALADGIHAYLGGA